MKLRALLRQAGSIHFFINQDRGWVRKLFRGIYFFLCIKAVRRK